jgi:hypothetical protein
MGTAIGPGGMGVLLELTGNDFELGLTVAGLLLIAPVAMFIAATWLDRRMDLVDRHHHHDHHDHPQGGKAPAASGSHGYTALGTNEAEEGAAAPPAAPCCPEPLTVS